MASNLTRFDPFTEMARFERANGMEDLIRDFGLWPAWRERYAEPRIKVDVAEMDHAYTVHAEIPGVKKDDIKVDVSGNQVSIRAEMKRDSEEKHGQMLRAERYYGEVRRTFTLDHDIDDSKVSAKYAEGVLTLTLPKKPDKHARHVTIN